MTINEFKAWLAGYSHTFENGVPNADQWKKIEEAIGAIKTSGRQPNAR